MHEVLYVKDNIDKVYISERNQQEENQSRTLRR